MLARERAARVDAGDEDRLGQLAGAFGLARHVLVVEDERVQVAVTGVEDVADPQAVLALELGDPAQHPGELRPRDDTVLDVVALADAAHGPEGRLAALPEERALGRVGGGADLESTAFTQDPIDRGDVLLDLRRDAVELDDQDRSRLGIARVDRGLGGLDRQPVHHLDRGRKDAGGDDVRDGGACVVGRIEGRELRDDRLRPPQEPQRDLGGDPEGALRADEDAEHVGAGGVEPAAAETDDLAVREHHGQPGHVVDREPVLEAVRAARVLGDVAADRAHLLAGGIGRVVEPVGSDRVGHLEVRHAGLDDDSLRVEVDVEHAVHARQRDDDALGDRERAAGEAGAGAARDEGDPVLVAGADDRLDVLRRLDQADRGRDHPPPGQPVALVGAEILGLEQQRVRGQHGFERRDELGLERHAGDSKEAGRFRPGPRRGI